MSATEKRKALVDALASAAINLGIERPLMYSDISGIANPDYRPREARLWVECFGSSESAWTYRRTSRLAEEVTVRMEQIRTSLATCAGCAP